MKKILLVLMVVCLFLTGCGNYNQKNIIKELKKEFDKSKGYKLSGELSVNNNDEIYNYDVVVYFKKDNYYKVILTNVANEHTQVILKNKDGVYVLTPSLNKSFKFQSDWPYDNSQIYLLETVINDIDNDSNKEFSKKDNKYIYKTKVNYPNNPKLVNQKVILNDKLDIEKVVVYDKDGIDKMTMSFNKIDFSPKFSDDEFKLSSIIDEDNLEEEKNTEKTSTLDDIIYPLFLPSGTKLIDEEKIDKENGERVIMSYDGEKSFLLVEETQDVFSEFTVIPSSGEPFQLMDTLGVVTDNSLSWTSSGIDYYLVSDVMSRDEMIEVAQSIVGVISTK